MNFREGISDLIKESRGSDINLFERRTYLALLFFGEFSPV